MQELHVGQDVQDEVTFPNMVTTLLMCSVYCTLVLAGNTSGQSKPSSKLIFTYMSEGFFACIKKGILQHKVE